LQPNPNKSLFAIGLALLPGAAFAHNFEPVLALMAMGLIWPVVVALCTWQAGPGRRLFGFALSAALYPASVVGVGLAFDRMIRNASLLIAGVTVLLCWALVVFELARAARSRHRARYPKARDT
jgi:hypothetical protein